jgi:hypothetical protein
MDPAIAGSSSPAGGGRGGRGGRGGGGAGAGPTVLPGNYSVTIQIPGISRALRGQLTIVGDAEDKMSVADRASRQASLMQLYDLQKKLIAARAAQSSRRRRAGARVGRAGSIDRYCGRVDARIESFNTPATADQRRQIAWAQEDATRALRGPKEMTDTGVQCACDQRPILERQLTVELNGTATDSENLEPTGPPCRKRHAKDRELSRRARAGSIPSDARGTRGPRR